jgi:hypothetical protein
VIRTDSGATQIRNLNGRNTSGHFTDTPRTRLPWGNTLHRDSTGNRSVSAEQEALGGDLYESMVGRRVHVVYGDKGWSLQGTLVAVHQESLEIWGPLIGELLLSRDRIRHIEVVGRRPQ